MVYFVGGGPGAPDLLTIRGARAIAAADVVVWGQQLLMESAVTEHARPDAELLPWPPLSLDELKGVYDRVKDEDLVFARVQSGDATLFGTLAEEIGWAGERGLAYEVVPGVSAVAATAAALGSELTGKDSSQPVVLGYRGADGGLAWLRGSHLAEQGGLGATLALFMSAKEPHELQQELLAEGYTPETPCAVGHRVSWPEEVLLRCRLDELGQRVSERDLGHLTLVLVGVDDASAPA